MHNSNHITEGVVLIIERQTSKMWRLFSGLLLLCGRTSPEEAFLGKEYLGLEAERVNVDLR